MSEKKGMFDFTANYVIRMFVVRLMLICSKGGEGEVIIVRLIALVSLPNIDTVLAEKHFSYRITYF